MVFYNYKYIEDRKDTRSVIARKILSKWIDDTLNTYVYSRSSISVIGTLTKSIALVWMGERFLASFASEKSCRLFISIRFAEIFLPVHSLVLLGKYNYLDNIFSGSVVLLGCLVKATSFYMAVQKLDNPKFIAYISVLKTEFFVCHVRVFLKCLDTTCGLVYWVNENELHFKMVPYEKAVLCISYIVSEATGNDNFYNMIESTLFPQSWSSHSCLFGLFYLRLALILVVSRVCTDNSAYEYLTHCFCFCTVNVFS